MSHNARIHWNRNYFYSSVATHIQIILYAFPVATQCRQRHYVRLSVYCEPALTLLVSLSVAMVTKDDIQAHKTWEATFTRVHTTHTDTMSHIIKRVCDISTQQRNQILLH